MPNDTKPITDTGNQPVTTGASTPPPPPMNEDVVLPPMVPSQTTTSTTQTTTTSQSSVGPDDDIVKPMVTTPIAATTRRNSTKGKVIATILGLFLLIGGIGAGVMLVGQDQNIGERADFDQGCYDLCRASGKGHQVCTCNCGGECTRPDPTAGPTTPGTPGCGTNTTSTSCTSSCSPAGWQCKWLSASSSCVESTQTCGGGGEAVRCTAINGQSYSEGQGVCTTINGLQNGNYCTCEDAGGAGANPGDTGTWRCAVNGAQCTIEFNDPRVVNETFITNCTSINFSADMCVTGGSSSTSYFYCPDQTLEDATANGCQLNPSTSTSCLSATRCGTQQIDMVQSDGKACFFSVYIPCSTSTTPPTNPTPTPPAITAQCQNVKAYSETWTLLTDAQLAALRPTNKVNFCVTGVATGGSFDRARFTINNILQAETTTIRPTSTDFCQLYTIPAGTTTFNVTAEIHHVTLGWK